MCTVSCYRTRVFRNPDVVTDDLPADAIIAKDRDGELKEL